MGNELTQQVWKRVLNKSPAHFKGDDLPVESVSWDDCVSFCEATGLRFPGYFQWQHASCTGKDAAQPGWPNEMAWYRANSSLKTHPVGQKTPNAFGIYDMPGNVAEWCKFQGSTPDLRPLALSLDPRDSLVEPLAHGGSWWDNVNLIGAAMTVGREGHYTIGLRPAFYPLP